MHDPLQHTGWISVRHLRPLVTRVRARGCDVDTLLAEVGLPRTTLDDDEAVVPLPLVEEFLARLERGPVRPPSALSLGASLSPATFGVLGLLVQSCATLGDVLALLPRYNGLLSNIGRYSLVVSPGRVHLRWDCLDGGPLLRRHAAEYVLASAITIGRTLLRDGVLEAERVGFRHGPPSDRACMAGYQQAFGCPVYFGADHNELVFPVRVLRAPLLAADTSTREILQRHADEQLWRRREPPLLRERVARLAGLLMKEGEADSATVARQLGMSTRHLYRRLAAEGASWRRILDDVRLERARTALAQSDDTMETIAAELGFHSRHTFMRWFRNRTGETPGTCRRRMRREA